MANSSYVCDDITRISVDKNWLERDIHRKSTQTQTFCDSLLLHWRPWEVLHISNYFINGDNLSFMWLIYVTAYRADNTASQGALQPLLKDSYLRQFLIYDRASQADNTASQGALQPLLKSSYLRQLLIYDRASRADNSASHGALQPLLKG
jgi:hypothetical protein